METPFVLGESRADQLILRALAKANSPERRMVKLVLEGHPATVIAKKLGTAYGTIKNHRLSVYRKLDITTERELFLNCITLLLEHCD
jgi:DNA-binding NarL/FixJ family response regulator